MKKTLPEKKPVICVTIDDEIIVDEPAPAAQQETKAMAPQVSNKLNKALSPYHSKYCPLKDYCLLPSSYQCAVSQNLTKHVVTLSIRV